ncbi:unnamed protein product [Urochloa humidicola]
MDELVLVFAASTCSSLSPASFSIAGQHYQDLDFVPSEVLEQWWGIDDCCLYDEPLLDGAAWADELSGQPPPAPTAAPKKRRGRKPGLALTHVEAERQRRDKLNRRFCELRAAVPTVSRMDKASLLADAAAYIAELRGRVEALEAEAKRARRRGFRQHGGAARWRRRGEAGGADGRAGGGGAAPDDGGCGGAPRPRAAHGGAPVAGPGRAARVRVPRRRRGHRAGRRRRRARRAA